MRKGIVYKSVVPNWNNWKEKDKDKQLWNYKNVVECLWKLNDG